MIYLASSSPRRFEILQALKLPFLQVDSSYDERSFRVNDPVELVKSLSLFKAQHAILPEIDHIEKRNDQYVIIGADTVVVHEGIILMKPEDKKDAFKILKRIIGSTHEVYSGIALIDIQNNQKYVACCTTKVIMNMATDDEIHAYIETGEPMDKAGAYAIQGIGRKFIHHIEGDFFNVMGLPIFTLAEGLHHLKYDFAEEAIKALAATI